MLTVLVSSGNPGKKLTAVTFSVILSDSGSLDICTISIIAEVMAGHNGPAG